LNFGVKESPDKVSVGTVKKLTLENMGIAFGILSLGGTEPEIHLGVIYPAPIATYVLKNTIGPVFDLSGGWGSLTPPLVEDDPHTGD